MAREQVSFFKLISLATRREKCQLIVGWIFACLTGAILPCFIWLIGDVFDSFAPGTDPTETRDTIREIFFIMLGLCAGILVTSIIFYSQLATAGASIAARIRTKYLAAILRQDSAYFDLINYTELAARLSKETSTI